MMVSMVEVRWGGSVGGWGECVEVEEWKREVVVDGEETLADRRLLPARTGGGSCQRRPGPLVHTARSRRVRHRFRPLGERRLTPLA